MKKYNIKGLILYYSIALLVGSAMGIINPITSTQMEVFKTSNFWIGIISSSYFLFLSLGALFSFVFLKGKNIKFYMVIGLAIAAVAAIVFPFTRNVYIWLLTMVIMGIGISFNMTGVQALLHTMSDDTNRSVISGIYSVVYAIGFSVSTLLGSKVYTFNAYGAFLIGSLCLAADSIIVAISTKNIQNTSVKVENKLLKKVKDSMAGAFVYGFSETTVVSIYPVFLMSRGIPVGQLGLFIAVFVIGCLLGVIPITKIADKKGRKLLLNICILIALPLSLSIMIFHGFTANIILSLLDGAVIGPVYPLSLSLAVEKLDNDNLAFGTSLFTFSYGLGSAFGPILTTLFMSLFGNENIFTLSIILFGIYLLVSVIISMHKRMVKSK